MPFKRCVLLLALCWPAQSFAQAEFKLVGDADVQKIANGVLSLMQYTLVPDVTTSSLSISNTPTDNPDLNFVQFGGGFTLGSSFPLYLEGNAAYSRYDPRFIASNGSEERSLPFKWDSLSGTIGIGWDFPLAPEIKLRPIANFSIGRVGSDAGAAVKLINIKRDKNFDFLDNDHLDAWGYGGSMVLDIEHYRPQGDFDLEWRYSYIRLESMHQDAGAVRANAVSNSLGLWTRWRAPIGDWQLLHEPLRYVLEFATSNYFGDYGDALGFNRLFSLGTGLELDTSHYPVLVTRVRLVGRWLVGSDVRGYSVGLAASF